MGKLTDAFKKLESGRKVFNADVESWQSLTKAYFEGVTNYHNKLAELMKLDDKVLDQITDQAEKTKVASKQAHNRGEKLKSIDPSRGPASDAQKKAFASCDAFGKLISDSEAGLQVYDTKGKPSKEAKKIGAKKLLAQAKVDLAEIKKAKVNYEYQGNGSAQYKDVLAAIADLEQAKKKLASVIAKYGTEVAGVDDGK